MHLDTNTNRIYYYYSATWYAMANYDDTATVADHTHNIDGFVDSIYQYQGNGVQLPALMGTAIDGGAPATTSFAMVIDGGSAA
jgi:hypothetical protein